MHLKQQNNLLINKIRTTENFPQEASSGSLSFHPVLDNKKSDYKKKCQSNFAFWLAVLYMHCGLKEHETQFFFIIMWFAMPFSLRLTWRKVKNMLALQPWF